MTGSARARFFGLRCPLSRLFERTSSKDQSLYRPIRRLRDCCIISDSKSTLMFPPESTDTTFFPFKSTLSKSRPFHKNDNRFVEQKNSTLVRAYLGSARFDTAAQTNVINQLYERMWLYYNFFQPVMRLREKTMGPLLPAEGQPSRIKRRFDQARTPFDRLCETDAISEQQKEQLRTLRNQTNPRQLRQEIYQLIDQIFLLPGAVPGETEDVYDTLFASTESQKGEGIPVALSFERTASLR